MKLVQNYKAHDLNALWVIYSQYESSEIFLPQNDINVVSLGTLFLTYMPIVS